MSKYLICCLGVWIVAVSPASLVFGEVSKPGMPSVELLAEFDRQVTISEKIVSPAYARYKGVTSDMWRRIAEIGDPLDCEGRVRLASNASTEATLQPCDGNCINEALEAHNVVELVAGQFAISEPVFVGPGKTLKGAEGQRVTIRADDVSTGVVVDGGAISNIEVQFAEEIGVSMRADALAYRVIVGNTGVNPVQNVAGFGFAMHGSESTGNCLVSVEAYNGFNEDGDGCGSCSNGGNADGFAAKFGANNVTYIDSHAYQNSDDGFDFWKAGSGDADPNIRIFYSSANNNGMHPTRPSSDGNGIKFGSSSGDVGGRLVYGSEVCDNLAVGFDRNESTETIEIINSTSFGNAVDYHETENRVIDEDPQALVCAR